MLVTTLLVIEFDGLNIGKRLTPDLQRRFPVTVTWSEAPAPWARKRDWQSNAEDILSEVMATRGRVGTELALGLIGDDLFVPGVNFVFGLASREAGSAVVSVNRLKDKDDAVYLERVTKEVVHELGHLHGLPHCDDPLCVMHFSNTLAHTDAKGATFCTRCSGKLATP